MSPEPASITELLVGVRIGSPGATEDVVTRLYDEFRRRAHLQLFSWRRSRLDTTDLAHEAIARLLRYNELAKAENTNQAFRAFARAMRQFLVDRVHRRQRVPTVPLDDGDELTESVRQASQLDVLALDEALTALAAQASRDEHRLLTGAMVVLELHYFGGYLLKEIPEILASEYPELAPREGETVGLRTVERWHQYGLAKVGRYLGTDRP
jgi:hypothetical protein